MSTELNDEPPADEAPEEKSPTLTKAPPTGRKFPCPACGARLDFNPAEGGLKCPYCGFTEEVKTDEDRQILERNFLEFLDREESKGKAIPGRTNEVHCYGCGADVLLEDNVVTKACPFCGSHLESTDREAAHPMIVPESVLPFRIDLRQARKAFDDWLAGLWFAPNALRKLANLGELSGIYVPHWTYDSMTYTRYTGQRGIDYTTTETYSVTVNGKSETRTRTVVRTRWYTVTGEVQHFFDDVLICASKSLPADLISRLSPWDLPELEPFQPGYLSGFKTERYSICLAEGFGIAKTVMETEIDRLVRRDIGGDRQRVWTKNTRYTAITFKHLLLPIWVAIYRYHQKPYQILINGQSGKVSGYRPYSWSKIAAWTLTAAALIGGAVYLYMRYVQN